jgi:hypothetical protein
MESSQQSSLFYFYFCYVSILRKQCTGEVWKPDLCAEHWSLEVREDLHNLCCFPGQNNRFLSDFIVMCLFQLIPVRSLCMTYGWLQLCAKRDSMNPIFKLKKKITCRRLHCFVQFSVLYEGPDMVVPSHQIPWRWQAGNCKRQSISSCFQ